MFTSRTAMSEHGFDLDRLIDSASQGALLRGSSLRRPRLSTLDQRRKRVNSSDCVSSTAIILDLAMFMRNGSNQAASGGRAVLAYDFPDPALIRVDTNWYAFATSGNGQNIQVAASPSFLTPDWKILEGIDALPDPGTWAVNDHNIWAPDIIELENGRFVMYYAATWPEQVHGKTMHCVGTASSNNILGPYIPTAKPLACPLDQGGAIDPAGFSDPKAGNLYVVYKVDGNSLNNGSGPCGGPDSDGRYHPTPIMIQQVSPEDGITPIGAPRQILDRDQGDGPLIEAPSLFYNATSGLYFLTFSSNCYSTDLYDVSFAYSTCLTGDFVKSRYPLITTSTELVVAPGGIDITPDGMYAVYHGTVGKNKNNGPIRHLVAAEAMVAGLDMFTFPLA